MNTPDGIQLTSIRRARKMTVKLPEGAAFVDYDNIHSCVNFTTVSGITTTNLPENGKIALIGKPGDRFTISMD